MEIASSGGSKTCHDHIGTGCNSRKSIIPDCGLPCSRDGNRCLVGALSRSHRVEAAHVENLEDAQFGKGFGSLLILDGCRNVSRAINGLPVWRLKRLTGNRASYQQNFFDMSDHDSTATSCDRIGKTISGGWSYRKVSTSLSMMRADGVLAAQRHRYLEKLRCTVNGRLALKALQH